MDNNIRVKLIVIAGGKPSEYATAITQKREGMREIVTRAKLNPWVPLHDGTVKDLESLLKWEAVIPGYGCKCRKDYIEYKSENPPDFSSPESLWLWGVALHNWVNRKLDKPEITIEEARKIWSQNNDVSKVGSEDLL